MTIALIGVGISCVSLLALVTLFRLEKDRDARFAEPLRRHIDRSVDTSFTFIAKASRYLGREVLRRSAHRILHVILHVIEYGVSFILRHIGRLQHTNSTLARRITKNDTQSTLDQLTLHKEEISLSQTERQAHKEQSVGTKL